MTAGAGVTETYLLCDARDRAVPSGTETMGAMVSLRGIVGVVVEIASPWKYTAAEKKTATMDERGASAVEVHGEYSAAAVAAASDVSFAAAAAVDSVGICETHERPSLPFPWPSLGSIPSSIQRLGAASKIGDVGSKCPPRFRLRSHFSVPDWRPCRSEQIEPV